MIISLLANQFEMLDLLLPAGLLLVILWLLMRIRRRKGRPGGQSISATEQVERYRQAKGLQGDLEQVMVEVEAMARRFAAQLDGKAMMLEKLVQHADERIEKLEALQKHSADTPADTTHAATPADTSADTAPESGSDTLWQPPGNGQAGTTETGGDRGGLDDPLALSIYKMADAGCTSIEIAKALAEHVGKIELILALREDAS